MLINIASLNVCTFFPPVFSPPIDVEQPDRGDNEKIEDYLERKVSEKITLLKEGLNKSINSDAAMASVFFLLCQSSFGM
ncbi:hypothetical protein ACIQCX_22725 [Enterobacter cancerogenus]|uniref:hypothetical protein n=1 Tax=Enterobacter cancerogenus TaxID=69218 RepID=UPI003816DF6E